MVVVRLIRVGLSAIRAAAARYDLEALNLVPEVLVVGGVGQEDQPVRAGVGVGVLTGFPWTEYARPFSVHSSVSTFLWAGSRGVAAPAGLSLYPTHIFHLYRHTYSTYILYIDNPFMVHFQEKVMTAKRIGDGYNASCGLYRRQAQSFTD